MITYGGAHLRVRSVRGAPDLCEYDRSHTGPFEWASLSGDYEDTDDYVSLCISCHRKLDAGAPKRKIRSTNNRTRGDRSPKTKIPDDQIDDIRFFSKQGLTNRILADIYEVSPSQISRIVNGVSR